MITFGLIICGAFTSAFTSFAFYCCIIKWVRVVQHRIGTVFIATSFGFWPTVCVVFIKRIMAINAIINLNIWYLGTRSYVLHFRTFEVPYPGTRVPLVTTYFKVVPSHTMVPIPVTRYQLLLNQVVCRRTYEYLSTMVLSKYPVCIPAYEYCMKKLWKSENNQRSAAMHTRDVLAQNTIDFHH